MGGWLALRSSSRGQKQVKYMVIFHDTDINIGVFLIPKGLSIPLHDHPEMTVFT